MNRRILRPAVSGRYKGRYLFRIGGGGLSAIPVVVIAELSADCRSAGPGHMTTAITTSNAPRTARR
jgi:hypothetical protein